jgi:rare lipoprotein A
MRLLFVLLLLTGCGTSHFTGDYRTLTAEKAIADAMDKKSDIPSMVKVGAPYKIAGKWYTPRYDPRYDEVGLASWYGPGFHGNDTATGEDYHQREFTAAHPTLPMPSLVRVTNLDNGREIVVRINDRGPFVAGRIIDLSQFSAQALGVHGPGTAKVRVRLLPKETRKLWDSLALQLPRDVPATPKAAAALGDMGEPAMANRFDLSAAMEPVETRTLEDLPLASKRYPLESRTTVKPASEITTVAPAAGMAPAGAIGSLYVQAGAFSSQANAESAALKLSSVGKVVMDPLLSGGKTLYRVRLGPVANQQEAQALQDKVLALGFKDAVVKNAQ